VGVDELVARAVNALLSFEFAGEDVVLALLNLCVAAYDVLAVGEGALEVVEVVRAHELLVVVHEHLLLEDLHKAAAEAVKNVPGARAVGEGEHAVGLVERRLVAVADLEALLVPVGHVQLFGEPLDVSVDVGYLDVAAPHYEACGHAHLVVALRRLLDQLVRTIEDIGEGLVDVAGLQLGAENGVDGGEAAGEEVLLGEGHQVHRYLVHVHIQVALEAHRAGHVANDRGHDRVLLLEVVLLLLGVPGLSDRAPLPYLPFHHRIPRKSSLRLL